MLRGVAEPEETIAFAHPRRFRVERIGAMPRIFSA